MVEAALGTRMTPHELAPVEMHDTTGGIDLLVDDEPEAIAAAQRYLSYYRDQPTGAPSATAERLQTLVPEEGVYDITPVIEAIVDAGSVFELRANFGCSVITALARIDGRSVGILANQPLVDDGAIDENAATKIARFVEICDSYEYPILALIDTPGFATRWEGEQESESRLEPGMARYHARTLMAHHHRTAPLFSVQLRGAAGLGAFAMSGYGNGHATPILRLAWPTVELHRRDGYSAFDHANAFDDVIDPAETRQRIAGVLRYLPQTRDRPHKKHPNDTW